MESYQRLYEVLTENDLDCVPPGSHETSEVYDFVKQEHSDLCDDEILCNEVCSEGDNQPEWKHRVRTVQQVLLQDESSRVRKRSDGWYYAPRDSDYSPIPDDASNLIVGELYNRWKLHEAFGGQHYGGISTPADRPLIFIFTGDSGKTYGYEDKFLPDGRFLYTGKGQEGDMKMEGGNAAIRDHKKEGEAIHLFEDSPYSWFVSYVGQYEYVDHQWDTLKDGNDEKRQGIRFTLQPSGGTDIEIKDGTPGSLSLQELFEKAEKSTPDGSTTDIKNPPGGTTSTRNHYPRSEVVKEFAHRLADGICHGCDEPAPFKDSRGDLFLEVHHLNRRSDGGADAPRNVIAICPNCHRRAHHGENNEEFNNHLKEQLAIQIGNSDLSVPVAE